MAVAQCYEIPPAALNPSCGDQLGSGECLIGSLKAYVTGSPSSKKAVILVSDVFGYEAPNLRKLADKIAASGFLVVVPDYFHGDSYAPEKGSIPDFLDNHAPEKGFEDTKPLIAYLKSQGISSIGVGGICRGGKVVAELGKTEEIQAAVMFHPSLVTIDDIKEAKVPTAILGAEKDQSSPPDLIKRFEEVLSAKKEMNSFVKIFPGVGHGWTMRYKPGDGAAMKKAEEAYTHMIEWFTTYVH
ncbi:endo-1,3;1,4-beta-D-glucanase-like isoform X2 [Nymphaea colorata]|nr:endo-1,3;1,4-beta-D-glucanase-like isoform X2 [Nymphaea colorata]